VASSPVSPLETTLRRVAADLASSDRPWALIGGLAIAVRAEPRTTRDVDLAVAVSGDQEAEALVYTLQSLGYTARTIIEQQATGRLATVRFKPPIAELDCAIVDLLFASSGIEREIVEAAEESELAPGLSVPVARIGHLLALKVLSRDDRRRPQDWDDLRALLREADEADMEQARESLRLIEERGFHRGKRLLESFEEFVREHGDPRA
jgi:predicted nucleotidyltransferase